MHRIGIFQIIVGYSVASLMIRNQLFLTRIYGMRFLLRSGNYTLHGLLNLNHFHLNLIAPRRQQCGLIQQVSQISTSKARRALGNNFHIHIVSNLLALCMHTQNGLTPLDIRCANRNLPVKTARTQQSRVQNIRTVGTSQHNNALVSGKAVHLHQKLVQSLLPLVMTAAQARAPLAAYRVNLVNEDNAGPVLLGLVKQVTDTGSAHAHEHFHKIRTRN